jgi:ribonuclease HI
MRAVTEVLCERPSGGDRSVMLRPYRSLVRSKSDYGSFVYGSTMKTKLSVIVSVHNTANRVATGTFRTSRRVSLYAKSGEHALSLRMNFLLCWYAAKLACQTHHPTCGALFRLTLRNRFERNTKCHSTYGCELSLATTATERSFKTHYPLQAVSNPTLGSCPPYLRLVTHTRGTTASLTNRWCFAELLSSYPAHTAVYTDGSFLREFTGIAVLYDGRVFSYRLHNFNSVFAAELYALYRALLFIRRQSRHCRLLCTDSLISLPSLPNYSPDNPIMNDILIQLSHLQKTGKSVVFCWVAGHAGLPGNEGASAAARAAALHRYLT